MDSVSELHGEVDSIQTSLILLILPTAITECRLCLSAQHYEVFIKIRKIYHVGLKGFTRSPAEPRNFYLSFELMYRDKNLNSAPSPRQQ
jgi:hypothetical protein